MDVYVCAFKNLALNVITLMYVCMLSEVHRRHLSQFKSQKYNKMSAPSSDKDVVAIRLMQKIKDNTEPEVYNQFKVVFNDYQQQLISRNQVLDTVSDLLKNNIPDLYKDFITFLGPSYEFKTNIKRKAADNNNNKDVKKKIKKNENKDEMKEDDKKEVNNDVLGRSFIQQNRDEILNYFDALSIDVLRFHGNCPCEKKSVLHYLHTKTIRMIVSHNERVKQAIQDITTATLNSMNEF
jgi:hypothetical protein